MRVYLCHNLCKQLIRKSKYGVHIFLVHCIFNVQMHLFQKHIVLDAIIIIIEILSELVSIQLNIALTATHHQAICFNMGVKCDEETRRIECEREKPIVVNGVRDAAYATIGLAGVWCERVVNEFGAWCALVYVV